MSKDTGGPAFPHPDYLAQGWQGMTVRDYFAAKAMAAMTSDYERVASIARESQRQGHTYAAEVALQAYVLADAMLKAREA